MFGRKQWGQGTLALVGTLAISASVLASCGGPFVSDPSAADVQVGTTTTVQPKRGGHLVYGLESDPNGFDPTRNAWDNAGIQVANAIFDPLVAVNAEGQFQPYLAESFASNDDYTVWLLKLRPGVQFSNGEPLNADALALFVQRIRESYITGPPAQFISDVRKVDELTIQVSTSKPWATLPALLSGQGGYVVAPAQLNDPNGHSNPIGTGPFMLSDWKLDRQISLVRNPRYWRDGLPYLNAVDFVIEPLGNRRIDKVLSGDMDVTAVTASWDLRALEDVLANDAQAARLSVARDGGDTEKTFVMFNTTKPPLSDVRVRQAIAYATDMAEISAASGTHSERAQGPFSPQSPYFTPVAYPMHNPDKARSLLTEYLADTSVRGRRDITFQLMAPDIGSDVLYKLIAQWERVGIKAELAITDVKTAVRLAVGGQYDAMILRYFAAPDPDVLWHFFVSDTITELVSLNFTRLRNDEISSGMTEGRSTQDVNVRKQAYAKVQRAMAEQMPYLWMDRSEWRVITTRLVRDARSVTLPDGSPALGLMAGTFRLTETWVDR